MELKIEQVAIPEKIAFNYEELKAWATDIAKSRENIVFTGTKEEISARKKDRADLNRIDKTLNDERIRQERKYMAPFELFKSQINEVRGIIKTSSSVIDGQIKEIEEQQRQEKKQKIEEFFSTYSHPEWLKLSQIWEERWLNASVTLKRVQEEIDGHIDNIEQDIATLSDLPEFAFEAIETYKTTLDLNKSIAEGHRLSEMQKRKAEQEKARAERERLRKEQEERARQEMPQANTEPFIGTGEIQMQHQAKEEVVQSPKEIPTYVCFKALLTVAQALELKEFFESRSIEFSRI